MTQYVLVAAFAIYGAAFLIVVIESLWLTSRQTTPEGVRNLNSVTLQRQAQLGVGLAVFGLIVGGLATAAGSIAGAVGVFLVFGAFAAHRVLIAQTVHVATLCEVDDSGVLLEVGRGGTRTRIPWSGIQYVGYGGAHHPPLPRLWGSGLVEALLITGNRTGPYREAYVAIALPDSSALSELLERVPVQDMPATWGRMLYVFGLVAPVRAMIR